MADNLQFQLDIKYESLAAMQKALAEARKELVKIAVTAGGEVSQAFQKQQQVVSNLSTAIKNYTNLQAVQKNEMEAVWASLDKLNKAGAKQQEIEVRKTQAIQQNIAAMVQLSKVQMSQTLPAIQGTQTASANASMALLNLNYVIRDSPYFFNNFALGLLAVGNNLNPLIDSFSRLRAEAGTKAISTFTLLKQALVGGAGISIAFSLVVTAIQSFVFWQSKSQRESEKTKDKLKEEREEVSKLRSEYAGLVKDRELSKKDDTSLDRLDSLRKQRDAAQKIVKEKEAELKVIQEIDKKNNAISINQQELNSYLEVERKHVENLDTEIGFILFAWQKLLESQKDSTKELKEQKKIIEETRIIQFKTAQELFDFETNRTRRDPRQESWEKLEERLKGASGGKKGKSIKEDMKEFQVALEMAKVASQELGQYLADAFVKGKFALDAFIASLIQAITQMIILKAITSFLNPVGTIGSAVASVASPASLGKVAAQGVVVMGGKIEMDSNKFVVKLNKAQSRQRTHYGISNGVEFTN